MRHRDVHKKLCKKGSGDQLRHPQRSPLQRFRQKKETERNGSERREKVVILSNKKKAKEPTKKSDDVEGGQENQDVCDSLTQSDRALDDEAAPIARRAARCLFFQIL